ncbi:Rhomboid protein 2 [Wickerhamiella sorbophila]|uniref:Rhomboid-type serine protease 2 n=1 Tax=Wickerhamiella sorbophila TaxID=45607 RepID=A0A2T0FD54_9ASCO|nr:Rhomboid protein 2 [Wickerhamiella sorbophila]PRT52869.1 Rhomboid protein 2 [Wickerhamiella sorbophila]
MVAVDVKEIGAKALHLAKSKPPALTTGMIVFLAFLYFGDTSGRWRDANVLNRDALLELEIGRISMYPLFHLSFLHLLVNLVSFIPLLGMYESVHGTVRTGIVLNVTAVLAGIAYCIIMIILGSDTAVAGASGWVFTWLAYFAWKQHEVNPKITLAGRIPMLTWATPLIPLVLSAIVFPSSSLLGHVLGLLVGYAYGMGYINFLIEPSTNVVEWIESKITPVIAILSYIVTWVTEVEARQLRTQSVGNILPISQPGSSIAASNGPGHVLGSE